MKVTKYTGGHAHLPTVGPAKRRCTSSSRTFVHQSFLEMTPTDLLLAPFFSHSDSYDWPDFLQLYNNWQIFFFPIIAASKLTRFSQPEEGSSTFLRNAGTHIYHTAYKATRPVTPQRRRQNLEPYILNETLSWKAARWKPQSKNIWT
jgi:hypothetical protein